MATPTLLRNITWDEEGVPLDGDFDSHGRLCTLLRTDSKEKIVNLDGARRSIPVEWSPHVRQIRWLADNQVILWPIAQFTSHGPYIGTVSLTGSSVINSSFPLDIFADQGFVACTFSEEQIVSGVDFERQSDLISIFSPRQQKKIVRFVEYFVRQFSHEAFCEVVHGVIDGITQIFWFTAYRTEYIWCLSFEEDSEDVKVRVCKIGYPLDDVISIFCRGETSTLLIRRGDRLISRKYVKTDSGLAIGSESDISLVGDVNFWFGKIANVRGGRIAGRRGDLMLFINQTGAALVAFGPEYPAF